MKDDDIYVDPQEVIANAIARGISAEDQMIALIKAVDRCNKKAQARKGIVSSIEAQIPCVKLSKQIDIISANADKINTQIFGDPYDHSPRNPDQPKSDRLYDSQYWQYYGKSSAEIKKALNHLYKQPLNLTTRARRNALFDLLNNRDYNPPVLDPNAPPAPRPSQEPDEQPDLGDNEMRASSVRRRPQARRKSPRKLMEALLPVAEYWTVETRTTPTVHFIDDCPACPAEQADVQQLDEAMHPLQLAEELGGRACGTCLKMLKASEKEGFLFGSVTPRRTLVIWRDRLDYETPGILGFGGSKLTVAADEIEAVAFPSPTKLVVVTSGDGEIKVSFDRAAEGDMACEAFRRLGWSFENSK